MLPGSQNNSRGISIHFTHWNIYGHYFCSKRKIPCHDKQWVLEVFDIKVNSIRIIHSPRTESNMWRGNQKVGQSDGNLIILFPFRYAGKTKEKLGYCFSRFAYICNMLQAWMISNSQIKNAHYYASRLGNPRLIWAFGQKSNNLCSSHLLKVLKISCISRISCSNQIDGLAGSFKLI